MKEIDDKFDKYEKVIERTSKLILKIVTTLAALVGGIVFAWNQLHDNLDSRHVHEEDTVFQEYLESVEGEEMYESVVDSAYEDSLYREFYHLDEVLDTIVPVFDTIVPINDTLPIDTAADVSTPETVVVYLPQPSEVDTTPVIVTLEVRDTMIPDTAGVDSVVVDTTLVDTIN